MTPVASHFRSLDPSDGTVVWTGAAAGPGQVAAALGRARRASGAWAARPLPERAEILRRFAGVVAERTEALAALIAREVGKPLWEARAEVGLMAAKVEISIAAYQRRCAEFSGGGAVTRFRPHGVVAVLGPYNFPAHLPNGHIVPALLAGNVVVFKPSELAPAVAEATHACWREAGLPEDALQVLQGGAETGAAVAAHPDLDGLFFTGSAATGLRLAAQFAATPGKILALEMGGNNPLIVDTAHLADAAAAVEIAAQSAFLSAGQRCTCARRLIVVEAPGAEALMEALVQRARGLRVGDPFAEPPPFMGPLASADFPPRILAAQEELLRRGARALLAAAAPKPGTGFLTPGILDVTTVRDLPDREIFGPLLQVLRVPDLDAAVAAANATRFGLAAGILSDDEPRARRAMAALRAGLINWNRPLTGASSAAPFGGIKASGNHRPSAFFAADYCAYPVASLEAPRCAPPPPLPPAAGG